MTHRKKNTKNVDGQEIYIPDVSDTSEIRRFSQDDTIAFFLALPALISPGKIETNPANWGLCAPQVLVQNPALYITNAQYDDVYEIDDETLRSRRLLLPPLNIRYRNVDLIATQDVLAANGNINSIWFKDIILKSIGDPSYMCKNPCLDDGTCSITNNVNVVKQTKCSVFSPRGNCSNVVNVRSNPVVNPVVKTELKIDQQFVSDIDKNISTSGCQTPYSSTLPRDVLKTNVEVKNYNQQYLDTTAYKFGTSDSVTLTNVGPIIRENGGYVTNQGIPYTYANPLNMGYSQPSIINSYNNSGNLTFCGNSVKYEPLISGVVNYNFPLFTVTPVPYSQSASNDDKQYLFLNYVYYQDATTYSTTQTVKISANILNVFLNNLVDSLFNLQRRDPVEYGYKLNNLLLATGYIPSTNIPTDTNIINAFVIWVYSYIGFVGGTRWTLACGNVPSNIPWIPIAGFDFAVFDNSNDYYSFSNTYNRSFLDNADYLFTDKFLLYADLAIQSAYMVLDERYQYWAAIAAGGWYAIIRPRSDTNDDYVFRHIYIINSLLCQKLWQLQDCTKTIQVNNIARDARLLCLEKKMAQLCGQKSI